MTSLATRSPGRLTLRLERSPWVAAAWVALGVLAAPTAQAQMDAGAAADASGACGAADASACAVPLDWESPRGLALGSGGRANAASTAALMYNPAALVLGGAYHVEGLGDYMADSGTVALGAAITDSATSRLAGGVALRGFLAGRDGYKGIDTRLALALPFSDAVSLGVAGRYLNVDQEIEQADGSVVDVEVAKGITIDAAFRFQPAQVLHVALLAFNLVDLDSALTPVTVGGALAVTPIEELAITADVLVDVSTFADPAATLGAGVEFLAAGSFPLRGGYSVETERSLHRLGVGVGYVDQEVGVDIGLRHDVDGGDETRVMLGLRYHMQ